MEVVLTCHGLVVGYKLAALCEIENKHKLSSTDWV